MESQCIPEIYFKEGTESEDCLGRLASGLLSLLPRIGKAIASTALGVASAKMRGVPLLEALMKRGLEAGNKLLFNRNPAKRKKNS